ncbi:hypothetical protein ACFV2Q_37720 [Streptomyces sp. NPDC059650]|uniref:hypothetical protein n=1 Tax=Streptomyces sp. NPDC059650 TaxID=3346896 RepID=UPI003687D8D7
MSSFFQLVGLTCIDTTSGFGADQVRIYFERFGDVPVTMFFDENMNVGDEWDLNELRHFTGPSNVRVVEEDHPGDDDLIGEFEVTPDDLGEHQITLGGDGSQYILRYRIGES